MRSQILLNWVSVAIQFFSIKCTNLLLAGGEGPEHVKCA
jgi:hypothetical protein